MARSSGTFATQPHLDWAALEAYLMQRPGETRGQMAARIGTSRTQLLTWIKRGWISLDRAEQIADVLGVYPDQIWPEYMELAAA